ncbi:MAG: hypothetical protein LUC24_00450, partial [Bacteroidales bacterium]|nr:hypothetical protein [Bacteroidales bacterium]
MKKILFTICLAALSGLLLVSCDDSGTQVGSVPTLTVTSAITVASDGGEQFITCSVTDPREDGEFYLSTDVSWISDFNVIDETVSFMVAENTGDQLRSGNITVLYGYSGGSISKKVGVVQNPSADPTLSVQPAAVTIDFIGGKCSFT